MGTAGKHQYKNEYEFKVTFDHPENPDYPYHETFTVKGIDVEEASEALDAAMETEIETFHDEDTTWASTLVDVH